MIRRFDISLNHVSLSAVCPEATIIDIEYSPAQIEDQSMDKALGSGVIRTKRRFLAAHVTVCYDLSIYNPNIRQRAIERIQEWAVGGGILRTTDRDSRRLNVHLESGITLGSALRWTNQLTLQFIADENPFWENDHEETVTITSTGTMKLSGTVGYAPVSAVITSESNMTSLTVTCGTTSITLSGISTSRVEIGYDDHGFLTITNGTTSLLANRTGSDELLLPCGKTESVSVSSDVSVSCRLTARGRWL